MSDPRALARPRDSRQATGRVPPARPDTAAVELIAQLVDAVEAAADELDAIADMPQPMPDGLVLMAREHEAMLFALKEAPDELKPRLRAMYQYAFKDAHGPDEDLPAYPVDTQVRARLGDVLELVRRARLLEPELRT